ncbi:hypothetical protein SVI_3249 [Shewanella violacea DSS12]|uniref:Uncharacterized protein n=1 Tax=Shewanella violacea (strain JCM 10179 / CIP 106290 / LMG 19151 / DSS12) TaxID=637905 RepID=D4ZB25_SHEVD|nr:hypothetical protein SVI_3249 [Shewanella violacea DSS12]
MADDSAKCLDHPDNEAIGTDACDGDDGKQQEDDKT